MALTNRKRDDVVLEGWLLKRGEHIRNWRQRYFYLFLDGALLGYKTKPDPTKPFPEPLNDFTIRESQIICTDSPKNNVFIVRCLQWTTVVERMFCAESVQERTKWCKSIERIAEIFRSNGNKDESTDDDIMEVTDEEDSLSQAAINAILAQPNTVSTDGHIAPLPQPRICIADASEAAVRDRITMDDFEYLKVLGKGTFGKVILCKEKKSSKLYAIKIIRKDVVIQKEEVVHTLTENRVLQRCRHPFLTELTYSFQTRYHLCFVMEFAIGGDLYYHLNGEVAATRRGFSEERTRFYGAEIVLAMGYLHSNNIVYRDLKLENVLLDREGHIKIADFGLCKEEIRFGDTTNTFCGTPEYIAPEVVSDNDYGRAVDWWSLGVVMYEMMCGRLPFLSKEPNKLFDQIIMGRVRFPQTLSDEAKHLLCGLLVKSPASRLGGGPDDAVEICNHVFFREIDWTRLFKREVEPPFKPVLVSDTDTRYFDKEFTSAPVQLTPPPSLMEGFCNGALSDEGKFMHFPLHHDIMNNDFLRRQDMMDC